jgi:hypothetical protein
VHIPSLFALLKDVTNDAVMIGMKKNLIVEIFGFTSSIRELLYVHVDIITRSFQ